MTHFFSKRALLVLLCMGLFALIYNLYLPVLPDEAYYWVWSRHLALSYFDGPPLTAYLIRFSTLIFGNTAEGIKIVALICTLLGATFVYRLAYELFDEQVAFVTLILLLLMPLTQASFVISTLDPPMVCFWALTLYWFYLAVSRDSNFYRYLAGISLGLSLLAKYQGVMLVPTFFLFLLLTPYRRQFKNINWYLAGLLALVIFSPVLIWNYQHDWLSFTFQYHHGVAEHKVFQWELLGYFVGVEMLVVNPIFFVAMFIFAFRHLRTNIQNSKLLYLLLPFFITFFYFFYEGLFHATNANWPAPAYISGVILLGYYIVHGQHKKLYYWGIGLSLVLIIIMLFPEVIPMLPKDSNLKGRFYGYTELFAQVGPVYQPGDIVISNSYQNASEARFHLPGQPSTYFLNDHHQYQFWSEKIKNGAQNGTIKSLLYIGASDADSLSYLKPYCRQLIFIKTLSYHSSRADREFVVYRCLN
ncbi:MAG: glycosyltransferase family 39 protein [Gammaproteobacteria bacterium]|nr:glycosyltransferase family 39 protein [Gammaproteobacteria bacterium]